MTRQRRPMKSAEKYFGGKDGGFLGTSQMSLRGIQFYIFSVYFVLDTCSFICTQLYCLQDKSPLVIKKIYILTRVSASRYSCVILSGFQQVLFTLPSLNHQILEPSQSVAFPWYGFLLQFGSKHHREDEVIVNSFFPHEVGLCYIAAVQSIWTIITGEICRSTLEMEIHP